MPYGDGSNTGGSISREMSFFNTMIGWLHDHADIQILHRSCSCPGIAHGGLDQQGFEDFPHEDGQKENHDDEELPLGQSDGGETP